MQKFIKKDLTESPRYFEADVVVSECIDLTKYRLMTQDEIIMHETPKPSQFHAIWVWDKEQEEGHWEDSRTEEEKLAFKRSQYPKLTRYQFMRGILEYGYKSADIEAKIMLIEDEYTRELTMIGFKDATNFERTDESILAMQSVLGLTDAKVDMMWDYALNL